MAKKTTQSAEITERPPVVVIMGHIDHGKSTLLDYIRKSNITASEAGGITQHLGAYEVAHKTPAGKDSKITFLDTPGHEAFTGIRKRGANVADIAILVVSAEDGVKKQTLEALKSIQEAELPYIVAMNKIDKPEANIERTKQNLAENEIYIEGYGGSVPAVPISALTGKGIPELLDMIMLVAELEELKADVAKPAEGAIIEAKLDTKKGISATLLIKEGTLKSGMYVVAEDALAPVRILEDFQGKPIKEASVSSPVRVIGFNKIPPAGALFVAVDGKKEAEALALEFKNSKNEKKPTIQNTGEKIVIPIIIKADVIGSLEGIQHELSKLSFEKIHIKVIQEGIGDISETDIKVASGTPDSFVFGFNVKVDAKARPLVERLGVKVELFNIIYKLIEFIQATALAKTPKSYVEESLGIAKILQVFSKNKDKQIVGGKVQKGEIRLGGEVKILRRDIEIARGRIRELQQQKQKAQEVREGYEFGTLIESKIEIAAGDKIECFHVVEK